MNWELAGATEEAQVFHLKELVDHWKTKADRAAIRIQELEQERDDAHTTADNFSQELLLARNGIAERDRRIRELEESADYRTAIGLNDLIDVQNARIRELEVRLSEQADSSTQAIREFNRRIDKAEAILEPLATKHSDYSLSYAKQEIRSVLEALEGK